MIFYGAIIVNIIACSASLRGTEAKICYSEVVDPYRLFGSKTAYDEVRGQGARRIEFSGCEPRQFYFVGRHGTRYPKQDIVLNMTRELPRLQEAILRQAAEGKGKLCDKDLDNLREWKLKIDPNADEELDEVGVLELKEIAQRYQARFPDLLSSDYSPELYDIKFTNTNRTESSARNFLIGLFGRQQGENISMKWTLQDDIFLKFYKTCRELKAKLKNRPASLLAEWNKFIAGPKVAEVVQDVAKRLGLKNLINYDDVRIMYETCSFEMAWYQDKQSPWCAPFKKDDLQVLEYASDLKHYYKSGYGDEISYEMACPPVKDLVKHFRALSDKAAGTEPMGLFRFSHSGLLLKLYARLGLFRDIRPPTADNYKQQENRRWRTSVMDPFASNIALVVLDCGNSGLKVVTYVQEKEVKLPFCGSSPCPIEDLITGYGPIADSCNVQETCTT